MDIDRIDGRRFFYFFYAGAMRLLEHQQEINKLNVFPVPDADTGTNLASTFRSIMDVIRPVRSYKETTSLIAEAALQGDPIALEAFEYTGNLLGLALANAALVTQPEVVVLSGGLAKAGDLIFKPTIKAFEKY